jgi:proline iminopeptidase
VFSFNPQLYPVCACKINVRTKTGKTLQSSVLTRHQLYPPIEPYMRGRLSVSELHNIYFEQCGNPKGKPVVILHGGPGGGISPNSRRFHDPKAYRIILFDQRGCGASTPHACLIDNTTWDLVEDIEKLRQHLEIEQWQLFGGSWGSTLALAYGQRHPTRVAEFVLRGIFAIQKSEIQWLYQHGANQIYPDAFANFIAPIPHDERHDLVAAYAKRLFSEDENIRREFVVPWSQWEGSCLSLVPDPAKVTTFGEVHFATAFARIECHYFINGGFMDRDGQLLEDVTRIQHLPCTIVQGRYDVITPPVTAFDLARRWPKADLKIVGDAGHSAMEPGIIDALILATNSYRAT